MTNKKTCDTCKFRNRGDTPFCLAEACYAGDMWEPEDQNASDEHISSVFSKGDRENIYNDFMKGVE